MKKMRLYRSGTVQIYRNRYQPKFQRDRNSGRVLVRENRGEDREGICRGEKESSRGGELNGR